MHALLGHNTPEAGVLGGLPLADVVTIATSLKPEEAEPYPGSLPLPHDVTRGSSTGSTNVTSVDGIPRCIPGAPTSTSYAINDVT